MKNPVRKNGKWLNSDAFRSAAIYYKKNKFYTSEPEYSTGWYDYWQTEREKCRSIVTIDGVSITGRHYFYLNYCPIQKVDLDNAIGKKAKKITDFPDFWDGDYDYFWVREIARDGILEAVGYPTEHQKEIYQLPDEEKLKIYAEELDKLELGVEPVLTCENLEGGKDLIIGKARRRGFSLKNASSATHNLLFLPNSYTLLMAYEKKYLFPGKKTLFGKVKGYINFINSDTAWGIPSDVINKQNHIKNSSIQYDKNNKPLEKGFMSEIEAVSFKDNPDSGRGADAYDIFGEEVGAWGVPGGLSDTIAAMRASAEAGGYTTGMMTLFGCVCKGTKVYLPNGAVINIENINKETGILGYGAKGVIGEKIPYIQPPTKKECIRIETVGGVSIECSTDHPLLWSNSKYKKNGRKGKKVTFKRAIDIKVGEQLMMLQQIPIFGKKKIPYARLVGLLIGDGYYGKGATPELVLNNEGIEQYVKTCGVDYTVYKEKGKLKRFGIKNFQKNLKDLKIYGQTKKDKRLPKKLYEYDMESLSELLGGYYDADGNVNLYKRKNTISIRLVSVVKPLLEEVQESLKRFGILSLIVKRKHEKNSKIRNAFTGKVSIIKTGTSYSLEIVDRESLKNFKKYISFTDTLKKERLENFDDIVEGYQTKNLIYEKTVKGEFFIGQTMDYLVPRFIKKITYLGEQDVYNLSTGLSHTYITNGFISHNTSGDIENGTADFADLFERPGANNFMQFHDIYGPNPEKIEGFFFPKQRNTEGYYDRQGNSNLKAAEEFELKKREDLSSKGATSLEIFKRKQEEPLNSTEAFGFISKNDLPIAELKAQLDKVKVKGWQTKKGTPCDLVRSNGEIVAKPILNNNRVPITSLKKLPTNISGEVVIYEQPIDSPPPGLYKIGYDPIRQEEGSSLAGITVIKGFHKYTEHSNILVAEYIGRKELPEDIDRVAEYLSDLYNTKIMHENEVVGVKNYFRRIKRLNLLAVQPDAVISKNIKNSKVARVFGCHMTPQLKEAGLRYTKEWLLTVLDYDEFNNPVTVIDKIYSQRLLEELIDYNPKGNYDLVSSLFMCMFQMQEETLGKEYGRDEENKTSRRLSDKIKEMFRNFN